MNFTTEKVKTWQAMEIQLPSPSPPGDYEVEVRAIDESGVESSPVKVKVVKVKTPPKAKLHAPADGWVVSQTPTIVVRAEDPIECDVKFIIKITPVRGEPSPDAPHRSEETSPVEETELKESALQSPESYEGEATVPAHADVTTTLVSPADGEGDAPHRDFFRKGGIG